MVLFSLSHPDPPGCRLPERRSRGIDPKTDAEGRSEAPGSYADLQIGGGQRVSRGASARTSER